jgi:carbon storage regulator CsrA
MLVLTRKQQQQIKIGDEITITILRVKGNTIRVGIEAPRTVRVVRGELPPEGQAQAGEESAVEESTIVEGIVRVTDDELQPANCHSSGLAGPRAAIVNAFNKPRLNSHLPQRRVLNRSGGAPLRVVMAGAVLAK